MAPLGSPNMRRMPSFLPAVRVLLLAVVALAIWCAPAMAQVEVTLEIRQPNGGGVKTISTGDVANPEVTDHWYTVRGGNTPRIRVRNGITIRQLLEQADVDQTYSEIEIPYPNASQGKFRLSRTTIDDPQLLPVLYIDKHGIMRFLRDSAGPGDLNGQQDFEISDTKLRVTLYRKSNLKVKVTADREKIDPGESVRFEASVTGGGEGDDYVFSWNFGDGLPTEGPAKRSHKFEKRGAYKVVVTAKVEGSSVSQPAPTVTITVGDPEQSDKDRDGGGTNADGGSDGGASDGASGYGGVSPAVPSPAVPSPPTPTPSPDPPSPPDIATSGPTISGNLLADASDPPATSALQSAVKAAREGTPKDDEPEEASVSTAALGIAGLFGLLALGAGLELRQGGTRSGGRRLRLRLPRRAT